MLKPLYSVCYRDPYNRTKKRILWQKAEACLEAVAHYPCTKIDCALLESNLETFNTFAAQVPATLLKRRRVLLCFFLLKRNFKLNRNQPFQYAHHTWEWKHSTVKGRTLAKKVEIQKKKKRKEQAFIVLNQKLLSLEEIQWVSCQVTLMKTGQLRQQKSSPNARGWDLLNV